MYMRICDEIDYQFLVQWIDSEEKESVISFKSDNGRKRAQKSHSCQRYNPEQAHGRGTEVD